MEESKNNKEEENIESLGHRPGNSDIDQEVNSDEKQCRNCFQKIHVSATVCQHCGQRQSLFGKYFGDISIIVSIVMAITSIVLVVLAAVQLSLAFRERIDTSKALNTATAAANEIADIKNKVEAQSATVNLVAKSAEEAKKLVGELELKNEVIDERLSELGKTTDKAGEALKEMERVTGFATTLLAAQNDSWRAYDQLVKWSNDKDFPLREMATNALVKIRLSHAAFSWGYLHIIWPDRVDPSKRPLAYFRKALSENDSILHAHLVHVVWDRSDIPKIERMQFLIDVLETSNSLNAKNHAGKLFVEAAGDEDLKWIPFDTDALLAWWKTHKNDIEGKASEN